MPETTQKAMQTEMFKWHGSMLGSVIFHNDTVILWILSNSLHVDGFILNLGNYNLLMNSLYEWENILKEIKILHLKLVEHPWKLHS